MNEKMMQEIYQKVTSVLPSETPDETVGKMVYLMITHIDEYQELRFMDLMQVLEWVSNYRDRAVLHTIEFTAYGTITASADTLNCLAIDFGELSRFYLSQSITENDMYFRLSSLYEKRGRKIHDYLDNLGYYDDVQDWRA